ncbi:hypothetical protein MUK72_06940 [Halococcus dombrowskii]|uniref:Uncharacterized protein n=2 Tax=Halococcus dombrowskii TaxID=179637 RepID=A0AAX3ARU1_HALDO|nr:hypothetical protein [Halococcus dombrowskii]UOO96433.1 hypothetical protein MUK72_06940 [Halococcus dombrowskii]
MSLQMKVLRGILNNANRNGLEQTVYRILTGPNVAGSYDGSRFIVGRTPAGSSGWIALWVKNDRVVKAEAGGRDKPSTAAPLQDPITLTTPDGRAVRVDPADGSLSVNQSKVEHVEIDQDDPVVQAGMILTVVSPIDGLGPTDEAAAVGIVGKTVVKKAGPYVTAGLATLGSILASGNGETTKQRESEQNGQEQNKQNDRKNRQKRKQNDQKGDRDGSDRRQFCGKLAQRCPPPDDLRPDGGREQEAAAELQQQGIPEDTIYDWKQQGYDLQQMSDAFDTYDKYVNDGGATLSSGESDAQGELGEILAMSIAQNEHSTSKGYRYEQGVELNQGGSEGEVDLVVTNTDGDVIATDQVKTSPSRAAAREARQQTENINEAFEQGSIKRIYETSGDLSVSDFNGGDFDQHTIGPRPPEGYNKAYDETYDLTRDELQALRDAIQANQLKSR